MVRPFTSVDYITIHVELRNTADNVVLYNSSHANILTPIEYHQIENVPAIREISFQFEIGFDQELQNLKLKYSLCTIYLDGQKSETDVSYVYGVVLDAETNVISFTKRVFWDLSRIGAILLTLIFYDGDRFIATLKIPIYRHPTRLSN